jgi:hypothetical protein
MGLRRKEGFSAQKKREEKQRSDKFAQKGELNSCSNRSGMAEDTSAYAGENASAYADENASENATANLSAYADENATVNPGANMSAYAAANVDENPSVIVSANVSANPSANTGAYAGANMSAYPGANAGANTSAYTDDEMDAYTRSTDPEELHVDTVRQKLYTRRGERDETDLLNLEDHSSRMMTRSHSELMTRPATLEMDERFAARNSLNGLFTKRNGLSKFRGLRTVDPPMSTWMTSLTTATMVTTANTHPRMSLVMVDHTSVRRNEGRMNESAPCPKTFGTQEKEVKDHSRMKDDDCRSSDGLEPTGGMRTRFPWEEDRFTLDDKVEYSVRQAVLQCRRKAGEEEERRRRRVYEEVEDVRRSFEREMEQHSRASTEALARADRMLAEHAESMERRVEELGRRMQRERQILEDQLKEEREENRRQGMMQTNRPVPATDEYMYIHSLHQLRSRTF